MPALPEVLHNWKTAEPYVQAGSIPWLTEPLDQIRVAAYTFYDSVFMNAPDTWKVVMYETNRRPLYVPSAKTLINAINRYVAPNMDVIVDPDWLAMTGIVLDPEEPDPASVIRQLFHRERFYAKFAAEKRMGRVRGDWIFMIQGDELRPEGSRISLLTVDPASYFPIWSEEDPDVRIGVHIVTQWLEPGEDDPRILRQTFRKEFPPGVLGGPGTITVEEAVFEQDKWGGPGMEESSPIRTITPPTPFDPAITEIPVYHIRSNYRNGEDYGTSDLAGLEALVVAINQGASDEDIALAMQGLGVYWSTAGAPIDATTGQELPWEVGPARVVEVPKDHTFDRVKGIDDVTPYQDHIGFVRGSIMETMGLTNVAVGNVTVEEAESGIALALRLAPTLAQAGEEELEITAVMRNLLNDLRAWIQVYEGVNLGDTVFTVKYGEKIPVNRKQRFDELMQLFAQKIVSAAYVRSQLRSIGYDMPDDVQIMAEIIEEKTALQQIVTDVTGARMDQELARTNGNAE